MPTNCIYCGKQYKQAAAYKKHMIICEILHSETTTEELTIRQMSSIISNLIQKQSIQEKKIKTLENKLLRKPMKIDIKKWMNKNMTDIVNFEDWLNEIKESIDEKKMNIVYSLGFVDGVVTIIENYIQDNGIEQPFKAFTQIRNIYIYDGKMWNILDYKLLKKKLFEIQHICLNYLNEYKNSLGDDIYNDSTNNIYLHKSSQILCNLSEETEKIERKLYNKLKINARNMIMNDFKIV